MLKLNPNDNQGIRYVLPGACSDDDITALKELLAAYDDEQRVLALYPGARGLSRERRQRPRPRLE